LYFNLNERYFQTIPGITVFSEKYKAVQPFKPHFFQNFALLQVCTSTSLYKTVGNIPESHSEKPFYAVPCHS
jgi:hypothetical protein